MISDLEPIEYEKDELDKPQSNCAVVGIYAAPQASTLTPTAGGEGLVAGRTPFEDISWRCAVSKADDNKFVPDSCRL